MNFLVVLKCVLIWHLASLPVYLHSPKLSTPQPLQNGSRSSSPQWRGVCVIPFSMLAVKRNQWPRKTLTHYCVSYFCEWSIVLAGACVWSPLWSLQTCRRCSGLGKWASTPGDKLVVVWWLSSFTQWDSSLEAESWIFVLDWLHVRAYR